MARISGVDLPRNKRIDIGLTYVFGIGRTSAKRIVQDANVVPSTRCADLTDEEFINLFSDVQDKISDVPKRVKLTSAVIKCNTVEDKNNLKDIFNEKTIDEQKITTSDYQAPEKEVLYIKYDPMNMKYLYLCAVCGTSWKKT